MYFSFRRILLMVLVHHFVLLAPVNALYNFSLFRVDDKVSFIILGVAKKMVVIDLYLSILVAELKSQLYVLAEGL